MRSRRAHAFTLLEVMAVVLMLGLVFLVMGGLFSRIASTAIDADQTETTRRGLLLLDRVARDLEGATLVEKPEGVDPLTHPWLFYADSRRGRDGADRVKFDSRTARASTEHASDLSVVAYWVEPGDADDLRLVRWISPALPESLDRDFPRSDDEGAQVLANGIARFGVRFIDEEGALVASWDSSTLERSGQLPVSAEITLALRDERAPEGERVFAKRVVLPMRPIDLEKALAGKDGEADEEEDDEDKDSCVTVSECVATNSAAFSAFLATQPDPDAIQAAVDAASDQCASVALASLGIDLGNCK